MPWLRILAKPLLWEVQWIKCGVIVRITPLLPTILEYVMSRKLTREEQDDLKQRITHKRVCRFIDEFINEKMKDVRQVMMKDVSKRIQGRKS